MRAGVASRDLADGRRVGPAANVISTAGSATLSVADHGAQPGRLVNGAFSLPNALQASATSTSGTGTSALGTISDAPLALVTYAAPVSNDTVGVTFRQRIGANDALRTGAYSKTLTFTLSTTEP